MSRKIRFFLYLSQVLEMRLEIENENSLSTPSNVNRGNERVTANYGNFLLAFETMLFTYLLCMVPHE